MPTLSKRAGVRTHIVRTCWRGAAVCVPSPGRPRYCPMAEPRTVPSFCPEWTHRSATKSLKLCQELSIFKGTSPCTWSRFPAGVATNDWMPGGHRRSQAVSDKALPPWGDLYPKQSDTFLTKRCGPDRDGARLVLMLVFERNL